MDDEFGNFWSSDPLERYNAHQRAKGREPLPDPDELRKREREQGTVGRDLPGQNSRKDDDGPATANRPGGEETA
jgi:hypothetical protein